MCIQRYFSFCDSRWQTQTVNLIPSCKNTLFLFGLLFVIIGIFFNFFWSKILESTVKKELVLSTSSKSYNLWAQNPLPLYINFYFFNWTNPEVLQEQHGKLKFEQVGPFRFREHVKKIDIQWNNNNTVSYRKLRKWYFEPKGSNGSLDDVITTLNIISLTAARRTRYWNRLAKIPLSVMLSSTQNISIQKRVREFLFDGFEDPLIEIALKIPGLSKEIPFDRFGWFYKVSIAEADSHYNFLSYKSDFFRPLTGYQCILNRNDSSDFDGMFNMETGGNGLETLGKLRYWNFKKRTTFYEDSCGDVVGSAGDFWPPPESNPDKIALFSPDMCRYIEFMYTKETEIRNIKGYRYDSGRHLFDNGTSNAKNKCFCRGRCLPSGALNVTSCRFGAPAFVSYPHFYLADSFYTKFIDGLRPEPERHEMYIVLDQKWGIPLEVSIRLQINILMESESGIRMFDGMPTLLFPMIWFEQKVTVPDDMGQEIQTLLWLPTFGQILVLTFYSLGFCCFVANLLYDRLKLK